MHALNYAYTNIPYSSNRSHDQSSPTVSYDISHFFFFQCSGYIFSCGLMLTKFRSHHAFKIASI